MTKQPKDPNLKVIKFKPLKDKDEDVPKDILIDLEGLVKITKEGKLTSLIVYYEHDNDDKTSSSSEIVWDNTYDPHRILGLVSMLYHNIVVWAHHMVSHDHEE